MNAIQFIFTKPFLLQTTMTKLHADILYLHCLFHCTNWPLLITNRSSTSNLYWGSTAIYCCLWLHDTVLWKWLYSFHLVLQMVRTVGALHSSGYPFCCKLSEVQFHQVVLLWLVAVWSVASCGASGHRVRSSDRNVYQN